MSHNTWTPKLSLTAPSSSRLTHKDKVWREGICTRADWTLALRRLNPGYYSLFVPSSNLPPRLARQGHSGRLRVFCLQSFSRLFGDEVVVHKRATPGSGPQRWRWFITRHGADDFAPAPRCVKSRGFLGTFGFNRCIIALWRSASVCFVSL